jgi:membrane dipeptidase
VETSRLKIAPKTQPPARAIRAVSTMAAPHLERLVGQPVLLDRRALVVGAGALLLPTSVLATKRDPIYIADMHFHLFFVGKRPARTQPLAANMAAGQATLVSWSLVGDQPWLAATVGGFKQRGSPGKGGATAWLKEETARVQGHLADQKLSLVRSADDVERALAGKPHVVLSVEGATFVDDGIEHVRVAYDLGVRHIQLVHFIANPIGDMQTEPAKHNGLTDLGAKVVAECNRLGILIDLAHCTDRAVEQALELSKTPVVWSHSSVQGWRSFLPFGGSWRARQLSVTMAKRIAARGGVVGLWALGADVGTSVTSYTDRMLGLADQLGDNSVAFGTDMNALSNPALATYSDLRRVVQLMEDRGMSEARIRNIAGLNYARVLTAAMRGRTA